jgi:drug/metabolite transporter (DMT)-like permease
MGRQWSTLRAISRSGWSATLLAGGLLALHFALWIPSLRFTTVASSTALVATQPVWAALMAMARGQRVPSRMFAGIIVAITGAAVLAGSDFAFTSARALLGDALALAGAIAAAAYVTAGQHARSSVATLPYSMLTYASASVWLFTLCAATGTTLMNYSSPQWQSIFALTLCGQVVGHTLINKSLQTISATVASTAILFEMPGSTLIAAAWIHQQPPVQVWPALGLVLVGLLVVVRAQSRGNGHSN